MTRSKNVWLGIVAGAAWTVSSAAGQPSGSGQYLEFDGVDDVAVSYADFMTEAVTLEAWVRYESGDPTWVSGLLSWGSRDQGSYEFGICPPGNQTLCFFINWNNGVQQTIHGNTPVKTGEWCHVAATYDGEIARLYMNGELDAEKALAGPINPTADRSRLSVGDNYAGASEFLKGAMDDVMVWAEARTAQQIADDMMGGPDEGRDNHLLARYTFDEYGSGVVLDRSGNGRHAHLGPSFDRSSEEPLRRRWPGADLRRRFMLISGAQDGDVEAIDGDLLTQTECINGCVSQGLWGPITNRHEDLHQRSQFPCGDDVLDEPYVDAETFLTGFDEITRDNCESAFYRFGFELPPIFEDAVILGVVNADDIGVVFLNRTAVSPLITQDDVDSLGSDRVDAGGHPLVGWPTADPFYSLEHGLFLPGTNELIIAVGSDFSESEPAGTEFVAVVAYDCMADWNLDGEENTLDFLDFLNDWNARLPETDVNLDGRINTLDVIAFLNTWNFGCPG